MAVTRGHGLLEGFLCVLRTRMANRLIPAAARAGRVLDIGCGSAPYFLAHTRFTERYGMDQVTAAEDIARFEAEGIRLVPYDADRDSALPFPGAHMDVITMLAVFEHIEAAALPGLLREIRRVLKPGGTYVLTTPAAWSDPILKTMARLRLVSPEEIDEHQDAYTHARIRGLLEAAGFAPENIECGYFECFLNLWVRARA